MPATAYLAIGEKPSDARTDAEHVHHLLADQTETETRVLGFPGNLAFDHSQFAGALSVLFNNVGDPNVPDVSDVGTKAYERAVIAFLADLFGASPPDEAFGYLTASGTAANEYGLFVGRERFPDAVLYYSDQAHYTAAVLAVKLRIPAVRVPCGPDGGMDPGALAAACAAVPGRAALVVATIESTMTGARDDVPALRRAAARHATGVHVHVDGALGGLVSALSPAPDCGFTAGADTIAVSGHKLIGSPEPCGIVLARPEHVAPTGTADYCSPTNHTLGCSRSGLTGLLLWIRLRGLGRAGLENMVASCLNRAHYAYTGLDWIDMRPHRYPHALTVTFDAPADWVCRRWHLPVVDGRAHLVAVEHVTADRIDALLEDIEHARTLVEAGA
jgi:histidine decarboxylase